MITDRINYTIFPECWWFDPKRNEPELRIGRDAYVDGRQDGCIWEFMIEWHELRALGATVPRLQMFDDSWVALAEIPEFFACLALDSRHDTKGSSTVDDIVQLCGELGYRDSTERVRS